MKALFTLLILLFTVSISEGQVAGPSSKVWWEIDATTLTEAQSFTYKYYIDNPSTATGTFANVPCVATASPTVFTCNGSMPPLSNGTHVIQITATNSGGESPRSTGLTFTYQGIPNAPRGLRLTQTTTTSSLRAPSPKSPKK